MSPAVAQTGSAGGPGHGAAAVASGPAYVARAPVSRILLAIIGAMLVLRLASLGSYPLMDTSEARYGEIARVMLETGNWVTPQETPGTPFWAKPPLSTWLSAGSLRLFGVNEFALRLPSLLCAMGVLGLCFSWSAALSPAPTRAGLLTMALLATSAGFFVAAGAVMTDPSLTVCTTAMLVAFHQAAIRGSRSLWWRYGFFFAAGLGMLAKGPVILLYVGAPIGIWTLWHGRIAGVWRALPWLTGTALAALVCGPWYALAQYRTPGFLEYFLIGEHFMRFLKPGWGGDLYGTAHAEPLGTIWVYLAGALGLNLALVLAVALRSARLTPGSVAAAMGPERSFLLLAALVPLGFFSFAGNIIWTYVLPALPPLAVLIGDLLAPRIEASQRWRNGTFGSLIGAGLLLALAFVFWVPRHVAAHSSAALVAAWRGQAHPDADGLEYVGRKVPASLRFYSRGAVRAVPDLARAIEGIDPQHERFLALAPAAVPDAQLFLAARTPSMSAEQIGASDDLALLRVRLAVPASSAASPAQR